MSEQPKLLTLNTQILSFAQKQLLPFQYPPAICNSDDEHDSLSRIMDAFLESGERECVLYVTNLTETKTKEVQNRKKLFLITDLSNDREKQS